MQFVKDHALFTAALRQCWTVLKSQMTSGCMAVLFISIGRMPFLAPTLDSADRHFALGPDSRSKHTTIFILSFL